MTSKADVALLLEILRLGSELPPGPGPETTERWRVLSADPGLTRLIRYEGAELWLFRRLRELRLASAPGFEEQLRSAAHRDTIRGIRIDEEATAVLSTFRNAGLPCALIKGQARRAAVTIYPWADARTSSDVDLLLPAGQARQAWDLLIAAGYSPAVDPEVFTTTHHLMPVWSERKVAVEIHTTTSSLVTPAEAWHRATAQADRLIWSGLPVTIPSATELLWHGLAHAFHAYHFPAATRLRSLLDGAAILNSGREIDWDCIRQRIVSGEVRGGGGREGEPAFTVPADIQYGWVSAAAILAGMELPLPIEVRTSMPIGPLLRWRRSALSAPVGRAARERLLEEAARCELRLPRTPSPPAPLCGNGPVAPSPPPPPAPATAAGVRWPPERTAMIPGLRHVLTLVSVRRSLVVRFVVTSLGRSALSLATILLVKEFLAGVLGEATGLAAALREALGISGALYAVAGALFLTYVGASLCAYDNQITQQRVVKVLELGMMDRVLHHLLGLSAAFFDRQSHGDIMQAVRQDVSELRLVVFALSRAALDGVTAIGLFGAALWLSPRLTLWALVVMPVAAFPVLILARRALLRSRGVRQTGYALFDAILQLLRGIRIIKVFGGERREARAALDKARLYFDELIEMVRIQSTAQVLLESIASLGLVLVIVIGGFDVMAGRLDWPSLLAFLLAVRAMHGPLNNVYQAGVSLGSHGAASERVSQLLHTGSTVAEHPEAQALPDSLHEIEFREVSFRYDTADVLSGLSFRVTAGETIGIAGPSGTGKTTLLNLVARFYDPTDGTILLQRP